MRVTGTGCRLQHQQTHLSRGGYAGMRVTGTGCRLQHQQPTSHEVGMQECA